MITMIGIGSAGCNIVDKFSKYEQYDVYKVDEGLTGERCFPIEKRGSPELYEKEITEKEITRIRQIPVAIGDSVTFVCCGSGNISGAFLRIMEPFANKKITVIYIKPDTEFISDWELKKHNVCFNVFQEYARSDLFHRMYIVDNKKVKDMTGDMPLFKYYDKMNETISSYYHMICVYDNIEPIHSSEAEQEKSDKIYTYGYVDNDGEECLLYDLEYPSYKRVYFAVNEKEIEKNTKLLSEIKQFFSVAKQKDIKAKYGYGLYSTNYPDRYIYMVSGSKMIQETSVE